MRYVYAVIGGLVVVMGITVGWMLQTMNQSTKAAVDSGQFTVAKGEQLRHVASRLEEQRYIRSAAAWTLYVLSTGQRSAILDGDYQLATTMTGREVLRTLTTNPLKDNEVEVKILEGWTLKDIATELEKKSVVNAQEFLNTAQHPATSGFNLASFTIASQKPAAVDLEGYLFPDTYRFFKHSTVETIIAKMLANLDSRFSSTLLADARANNHTPHEILTMASILEKELKTDSERAMGADLFWRRINIGMPLQSDATVNYVTGKSSLQPTIDDTKAVSRYNTYLHRGLPPGPINNPSLSAIRAAIYPEANTYLYYLHAPDGTTHFAQTYEQHLKNKATYLQ